MPDLPPHTHPAPVVEHLDIGSCEFKTTSNSATSFSFAYMQSDKLQIL